MAGRTSDPTPASNLPRFASVSRGDVLGLLARGAAERGYAIYQERRVSRLLWEGDELEASVSGPGAVVRIGWANGSERPSSRCSACGLQGPLCTHAAAGLLQWLDIRPTMLRLGPGTIWRSHSRHPFLAPARAAEDRVDLSHLAGVDLRSALELQLSLQRAGAATARLTDNHVEITITLPSGDSRIVTFSASLLPSALPLLRSLPRIDLDGELRGLELSEGRLQPVLVASWENESIVLEPGYDLADGTVLAATDLEGRIHGRWARLGTHLCRVLDPATPLVPFHRRGRQVLRGRDALRFLSLDHPQLSQSSWYLPRGHLRTYRQPVLPVPTAVEAVQDGDHIAIRPVFTAEGSVLPWPTVVGLLEAGFLRIGSSIIRAPDFELFHGAGFRFPKDGAEHGLVGTRLDFIRLVAEASLEIHGSDDLTHLVAILRGQDIPELPPPPGLLSTLRPYQQQGVAWLWSRSRTGIGALLADDMGLGKTHQVMGLLCLALDRDPRSRCLVVCPRGVLDHWANLLATFAPTLRTCIFHGPGRALDPTVLDGGVVLTTYDIIFRSAEELTGRHWEIVVFDEAQRIKNPRTKAARAARRLDAAARIALSGTPLENRLLELWAVVDLIEPGFLGSEREFRSDFRTPSHLQLHRLRLQLSVLTLRRLKSQVLSDLPDKVEDIRYCTMTDEQGEVYRRVHGGQAGALLDQLRDPGAEVPYIHVFALLTKLKLICDHPTLVDEGRSCGDESGKLEVFDELLDEALAGDHQVVVFSQYVKMVDHLARHLERRHIRHLTLTGQTRDRGKVTRRFNSEQHERVLLASLLAGGVGIDLTAASVVIHYDRWWNPAKEDQATDRVHRMGQRRFVQVVKLVTRSTIEERIDELIRAKVRLFEQVVTPTEDLLHGLSREELARLLDLRL